MAEQQIVARVPLPIMKVAAKVAAALSEVPDDDHDDPYVAQVSLGWEGKATDFVLVPDEFGSYDLAVTSKTNGDAAIDAQPSSAAQPEAS